MTTFRTFLPGTAGHHNKWFGPVRRPATPAFRYARACHICGVEIKNDVRGRVSHLRSHVREGVLIQRTGNVFELRDVDFADRARDQQLTSEEIDRLPWKQALDYIEYAAEVW
jgi:hypothetical protein